VSDLPPRSALRHPAAIAAIARFAALVVWLAVGVRRVGRLAHEFLPGGRTTLTQDVVVERTRAVARLVTSETGLRDVVVYENQRLGSTKRALIVVTGKVLTGIDLETGAAARIDRDARRIVVTLPPARVLGVEVTDMRTYDERSGLWNPFRPADRDSVFRLARAQLEAAARDLGVTEHAETSARRALRTLFEADGYTVEVEFAGKPHEAHELGTTPPRLD
jgi:hypothetical protein